MSVNMRMVSGIAAATIVTTFFGVWIAMEWTGRQPDSVIMLGAVAIAIGAAYQLWGSSMNQGVDAVGEFQSDSKGAEVAETPAEDPRGSE